MISLAWWLVGAVAAFWLYSTFIASRWQKLAVSKDGKQIPLLGVSQGERFPMLRGQFRYLTNGYNSIYKAFRSASDIQYVYQIPSCWDRLYIFSAAYIEEIKTVSNSIMDIQKATGDRFLTAYVGLPIEEVLDDVTRSTIQHQLLSVAKVRAHFPALRTACAEACEDVFPSQGEASLLLRDALREITLRTTGQTFVGTELSRNREWHESAAVFLDAVTVFSLTMQIIPPPLRPIIARVHPEYWRMKGKERILRRILSTELESRKRQKQGSKLEKADSSPGDLFDWFLDQDGARTQTDKDIINRQLALCFAGPHTLSFDMERVMSDLAQCWNDIAPVLHEECRQVLEANNGTFDTDFIDRLTTLDEFMVWSWEKDARRAAAFHRRMLQPYTLKDGTSLPKGAMIMAFSGDPHAVQDTFSISEQPRVRYNSTGSYFTNFGDGRHSCPGRRFATMVEKTIILYILDYYDLHADAAPKTMVFEDTKANAPDFKIRVTKREEPRLRIF